MTCMRSMDGALNCNFGYIGVYRGSIGIMEKKMEATTLNPKP